MAELGGAESDGATRVDGAFLEGRSFDEIPLGASASFTRTLSRADIELFAIVSGDVNPTHLPDPAAASGVVHHVVAHGMWGAALISAVLGTELPGPGTVYRAQNLVFHAPVALGDTLTVTVTARERRPQGRVIVFDCRCTNQHGVDVITGTAEVTAPAAHIRLARAELPEIQLHRHDSYHHLMQRCAGRPPMPTAIVHPCDAASLTAAVDAARAGLIVPVLVGPEHKIRAAAAAGGIDLGGMRIVAAPHSHAAAAEAVRLARAGEVAALMKGSLHTDELMHEVTDGALGLRTARRISHVYVMDIPTYPKPLMITDAAINIDPTLEDKRDICQNAIDLAHALGIALPKVAILSAVETVATKLPSTIDAAALCKMAERGQITGGVIDGPLAFDNAIDRAAATTKGITSAVAGIADILVVPDLEAGNMLAKQLTFLASADAAGIVLGARVPIMLASRADSVRTRLASCAVAVILATANAAAAAGGDGE
ncbi:MAG: bifunctional enoyl-CoA hydratase/phosphate acetyltransferase [Rhodospirillales bacterium]|nr:bifunctional enoyl-CoA hydratase/phosphate acetyltransferase [Rhodospirillales bacterium]